MNNQVEEMNGLTYEEYKTKNKTKAQKIKRSTVCRDQATVVDKA